MKHRWILYTLLGVSAFLLIVPKIVQCAKKKCTDQTKNQKNGPSGWSKDGTVRKGNMERKKTGSGLEYQLLVEGTGAQAQKGQTVVVHYTGWLLDSAQPEQKGVQFDSSRDRKQPFEFPLGKGYVIKGWDEGVALMKIGDHMRLYIPASLGYGAQGAGRVIPPNATLVFDVELLKAS